MKLSIRNRLLLALAGMLAPLAILSMVTFVSLDRAADEVEKLLIDPIRELEKTMHLQRLLGQAVMPANDYLIHGRVNERHNFTELEREIEKQFRDLKNDEDFHEDQKQLLKLAYNKWRSARVLSTKILSLNQPVGNRAAANAMERMDKIFNESYHLVDQLHSTSEQDLNEATRLVGQVRRNLVIIIVLVMLTAFVILTVLAFLVGRSLIRPIRSLENAVQRIAEGDYDERVIIKSQDEFGRLANSFNDMATHLKEAHSRLEELSLRDGLTGILNRRAFDQALASEAARAKRFGSEFSLIMFDIDFFKKVNDAHGHLFGDDVLVAITREVGKFIRPVDQFGRYGGEEFVIIMPETGIEGATHSAERLRMIIESLTLKDDKGLVVRITASFGTACLPEEATGESELIALADKRLYRAKREGRNKVVGA